MEFEVARNNHDDDVSRAAGCDQSADGLASQADGFLARHAILNIFGEGTRDEALSCKKVCEGGYCIEGPTLLNQSSCSV